MKDEPYNFKLFYISTHLMFIIYNLIIVGAFVWLAFALNNFWVILGLPLVLNMILIKNQKKKQ